MKQIILFLTIALSCCQLLAEEAFIQIKGASFTETNSYTGKTEDFDNGTLTFSAETLKNGEVYMEILFDKNNGNKSCLTNGSSGNKYGHYLDEYSGYHFLKSEFEEVLPSIVFYNEIVSYSPLDDRRSIIAIACTADSQEYYHIIIKSLTMQGAEFKPLFNKLIIAGMDRKQFMEVKNFLTNYIPKVNRRG